MVSESDKLLSALKFFLNDKIDTLRKDIKEDLSEMHTTMKDHNSECEERTKDLDNRVSTLEATKHKFIGAMAIVAVLSAAMSSIITAVIIFVIQKYLFHG